MKFHCILVALCLFASVGFAQSLVISDFEEDVLSWKSTIDYGDVSLVSFRKGGERDGRGLGVFRVDYRTTTKGTSHIVLYKDVDMDLTFFSGIELWVKTSHMSGSKLLVYLVQADGKYAFYPLKSYSPDMKTWQKLSILFSDKVADGSKLDLKRVTKVGLMIQGSKPVNGTMFIDDITLLPLESGAWLSPRIITPNGDGVLDCTTITVQAAKNTSVSVSVEDTAGKIVKTLSAGQVSAGRSMEFVWNALQDKKSVNAGEYTVIVKMGNATPIKLPVTVRTRAPWKPLQPQKTEAMPVALWLTGTPDMIPYPNNPAGARAYYDRAFTDIVSMGFDTVVMTWLPDSLWRVCLESARMHGLKVILHIPNLADSEIRSTKPLDEDVIEKKILNVKKQTNGFEDVIVRYMTLDEPKVGEIDRWIVVHRILGSILPSQPGMSVVCTPDSMRAMAGGVKLNEAVFDYYPQRKETSIPSIGLLPGYLQNYRNAAGNLPMWYAVQVFAAESGWRYPTGMELRASVYQALAAGSRGYIFFMYQSLPTYSEKIRGLVDVNGEHMPIASEASELAKELKQIFPAIADYSAASFAYRQGSDVSLGIYTKADGSHAVIIANTSPAKKYSGTLDITANGDYVDVLSKKTYSIKVNKITLELPAGGAVVLIPAVR